MVLNPALIWVNYAENFQKAPEAIYNLSRKVSVKQQKKKKVKRQEELSFPKSIFPGGTVGKEFSCQRRRRRIFLGQEDPLEEEIATHSSVLAWKIPWTEECAGLQSMGLHRVGQN